MGLESLNENLSEIRTEVIFSQKALQFKPGIEELRSVYYREMKKFVSIPSNFPGFGGNKNARPASAAVTKAEYSTVTTSAPAPALGDVTTAGAPQRRRPASAAPGASAALHRWSKFTPSDEEMTDSSSEFVGVATMGINRDGSMMPQRAATAGRRRRRRGVRSAGPSRLAVLSTPSAHHQVAVLETKYAKKAQAPRKHIGRMLRPDSAPAGWGVPTKGLPGLAGVSSKSEQYLPAGIR
jgi:hypothetical protein